MPDVLIIGGGISGLAAAYELHQRGVPFVLVEATERLGGIIYTERVDDFTLDAGPDSLLIQKPAALALCKELGIADRLFPMLPPRKAFVLRGGELYPLPHRAILGIPLGMRGLATTRLFSAAGRARIACEVAIPSRDWGPEDDESIASFMRRRFGDEAVTYLADPLLGGIHAGDVERLSIRALFPQLVEAEIRRGSILKAFRGRAPSTDGVFRSLPGGIGELVGAIADRLPRSSTIIGTGVTRLRQGNQASADRAYIAELRDGRTIEAGAVLLAVPAFVAGDLLRPFDEAVADLALGIPYHSTGTVTLAYARDAVRHPLQGSGFVVPRVDTSRSILAATWISSKWPGRAPADTALVRGFVGGVKKPELLDRDDRDLAQLVHNELAPVLRIQADPILTRVYRWRRASPQHEVGHLKRLAVVEQRLQRLPGLYVTGSGFRGVGIPDCIADGRAQATRIAEQFTQIGRRVGPAV